MKHIGVILQPAVTPGVRDFCSTSRIVFLFGYILLSATAILGNPSGAQSQTRRWLPEPEEVVAFVDEDGSKFGDPHRLVASPRGGFVIDDWSGHSVREISVFGELLWQFGRHGEGPEEFMRMMDMEFLRNGNLLVLDLELRKLTELDAEGGLVATHRVGRDVQVLPASFHPGSWSVIPESKDSTVLYESRATTPETSVSVPMPHAYLGLDPMVTEWKATNGRSGAAVIYTRHFSSFIVLDSAGAVDVSFDGIELIEVPEVVTTSGTIPGLGRFVSRRVDPKAAKASESAAIHDSNLFVLFRGNTDNAMRLIDVYSLKGTYLGSYLLPHTVRSIAILEGGQLATLDTNLLPTVKIWDLKGLD